MSYFQALGVKLVSGLVPGAAWPFFGGFGRLLPGGTHRARRSVPIELENAFEVSKQHLDFLAQPP